MKRILSVLLVALMIVGMLPMNALHAHAAETATETLAIKANAGTMSGTASISWSGENVTFTNYKASSSTAIRTSDSDHYRVYGKSEVEVTAPGNITKIVITSTSSSYVTPWKNSAGTIGTATSSGNLVTVVPTTPAETIRFAATAQVRLSSVEVTYEVAGGATECEHTNTTENNDGYAATCTEAGKTNSVTCDDCGVVVTAQTEIAALGHNFVDGVCSRCGQKLAVVSFSVPSQVAGVDSITANESGAVTLPEADDYTGENAKYDYTFAGWAAQSVSDTTAAPTLYTAGSQYTATQDVTLYAVYTYTVAGSGGSTEFVLTDAANIKAGDTVVITTTKDNITYYAMSNGNGTSKAPTATKVTVSGGKLADSNDLTSLKWDIGGAQGAYTFYVSGSTSSWLYCTSTNNGVRVGSNSANTFAIDSDSGYLVHNGTGRYIGVYNSADWRCYTTVNSNITGQTLCFFVQTSGGAEDYYTSTLENVDSSCSHTNTTETTVDASCTEDGSVTVTCDDCGAVISTEVITAPGHTAVVDAAKDPTCVDTGLTEGSHCSVCNAVLVAQQTVPATGVHTFVDGTCSVCGEEEPTTGSTVWQLVTDVNDLKAGDKIVIVAKNADVALSTTQNNNNRAVIAITKDTTNNTVGVIDGVQIITLENGTTDGTFAFYVEGDSTGYLYAASSSSNYLKTETTLSANSSWVITIADGAATVKAQGSNTRNWLRYNSTSSIFSCYGSGQGDIAIYKEIVLCEHENTENRDAVAPTCTTVGYTAGVYCTDCETYIDGHEVVAMVDHSYGDGVQTTAPGCETTGVMTYTCSVCGHSYTEEIPAAGHIMGEGVVVDATCETAGSKTYSCTVCGKETMETIPATGHSWSDWTQTKAPTCTEAGENSRTCAACGQTETQTVAALGHSWSDWTQTKAPTCTEAGEESRTCGTCGETESQTVPAEGHKYDANGVCTVCGAEISYFRLVNDYTNILSGGDYIIAARIGDTFYALDTAADNKMGSKEIAISGTGTEMKVIYAEGLPIWNIGYYANANNCVTIYNSVTDEYLTGGSSTSLGVSEDAWAWTFCDTNNASAGEDGEYAVVQSGGSIADGASAYVLVSNSVSADRAITFASGRGFLNYSIRTSGYNRELYFFKLVEAGATEYTVTFKENGTQTMTQAVPVEENVIELPEFTGAAMPEGYTDFVGWVTLPCAESLIAPTTIYKPGSTVAITEDTTFYALYTREDADAEGQAMSYHRVTDISQLQIGQKYIIVGLDTNGEYWAMSADQLSDDRGASAVTPDENGVITFLPEDKVAVFELSQGYDIGSFAFLDLNMNQFLYCSSSDTNASLKSQGTLSSAASFVIEVLYDETTGNYSTMMANVDVERNYLMFNTIEKTSRLFSCYKLHTDTDAEGNLEQNTFLYVGVSNTVNATYYATGLCDHQWDEGATTEPSCTNAGYTVYTCTVCGEVKIENVQAHGHNLGAATVIEPTCTEAGSSTSTCTNCGEQWVEIIPALGHTEVVDEAVAPTCTDTGLTEGKHCSVCDAVLIAQEEVAALGHTEVVDEAVAPTCTDTGLTEGKHCSVCNAVLTAQEEVAALGHNMVSEAGYNEKNVPCITHQCSRCDEGQTIEMKYNAASVTLANTLIVNFWTPADMEGTAQYAGFENISATFTYGKRVGENAITVDISEAERRADALVFPCRYITPSQIGDTITATLTGTYQGEEFTYTMEYGVAKYCYSMLNSESTTDAELRTLLVDLLYYCDAARTYTTYKADELVTDALTDAQKAERTTTDPELSSVMNAKYAVVENAKAKWKSASLIMAHATRMRFRFETTADISSLTVKALVGGEEQTAYIAEEDGQYYVYVDDLSGFEMRETVYVTLYEGETAVSNTITYSIESYACNKQNDADADLAALVKAMMRYGDSAIEYRN